MCLLDGTPNRAELSQYLAEVEVEVEEPVVENPCVDLGVMSWVYIIQ